MQILILLRLSNAQGCQIGMQNAFLLLNTYILYYIICIEAIKLFNVQYQNMMNYY